MDADGDVFDDKVIVMNRPKTPSIIDQILNPLGTPDKKAPATAAVASPPPPVAAPATVPEPPLQEPVKKSDPRPRPGDPYRAHALFLNRLAEREVTISFVAKDCTCRGFSYSLYEGVRLEASKKPGGGLDVVVRFAGTEPVDVRISGRNVDGGIYDFIARNTMPWVWERPPGRYVDNDASVVITSITFEPVGK